jgi:putative hydrolase of the HAD superfamily
MGILDLSRVDHLQQQIQKEGQVRYSGVLLDLFGTLIAPFHMREHMDALRECAKQLGISFEDCHRYWGETFPPRVRGEFVSVADNFDWIARQMGQQLTPHALKKAEEVYERFTAEGLAPVAGAVATLEWLASRGLRVGLVSNCAPDIPRVWTKSVFAKYFDYCAFSCQVGAVKPEPEIYCAALDALRLLPEQTLYVGDGSDEELSGAARCGLQPVLIAIDLSNTYDAQRKDVDAWTGPVIRALSELPGLVEGIVQS